MFGADAGFEEYEATGFFDKKGIQECSKVLMDKEIERMGIIIDTRIQRFIDGYVIGEEEENTVCLWLNEIDKSFHFENEADAQAFLNNQVTERVGAKELRKGYFDYTNEHGEVHRYIIEKLNRGKIEKFTEDIVL